MKRALSLAFAVLMASLLVACGSDTPSAPQSLSPNISGNWSGQTKLFGSNSNITLAIAQATSDPGLTSVEPLTGTLTIGG